MKPTLLALALAVSIPCAVADTPELLWETAGLIAPESVVFDAGRGELFVSNMGSYGTGATPGDGFISRVGADGRILALKWVTGLENPKGLALAHGRLYVGDDADLVEIDIASATIVARHAPADGPGSFNDCTADSDGNIYVCSGRLATVFRLQDGRFEPWAKLDFAVTGGINGLHAERGRMLLGGWSVRDAAGRDQVGHISTIDFADLAVGRLGTQPICHIDGIEPDGRDGYTVTDWITGDFIHVTAAGAPHLILKLPSGAADHEYIETERKLIVPLMHDNRLRAYRWSPAATQ